MLLAAECRASLRVCQPLFIMTEKKVWTVELLPSAGEHMALQFLNELQTVLAGTETLAHRGI